MQNHLEWPQKTLGAAHITLRRTWYDRAENAARRIANLSPQRRLIFAPESS
jgi:hypothetical protein